MSVSVLVPVLVSSSVTTSSMAVVSRSSRSASISRSSDSNDSDDPFHRERPTFGHRGVSAAPFGRDLDHDDATVFGRGVPLGETVLHDALHCTGGGRRLDAQPLGQTLHGAIARINKSSASI